MYLFLQMLAVQLMAVVGSPQVDHAGVTLHVHSIKTAVVTMCRRV